MASWGRASYTEQWSDNILQRPLLKYVGLMDPPYIPHRRAKVGHTSSDRNTLTDQQKRSEVEGLALYLFDAEAEAPGRH